MNLKVDSYGLWATGLATKCASDATAVRSGGPTCHGAALFDALELGGTAHGEPEEHGEEPQRVARAGDFGSIEGLYL